MEGRGGEWRGRERDRRVGWERGRGREERGGVGHAALNAHLIRTHEETCT